MVVSPCGSSEGVVVEVTKQTWWFNGGCTNKTCDLVEVYSTPKSFDKTRWGPWTIAKLTHITCLNQFLYKYNKWVYKPTYNWGPSPCKHWLIIVWVSKIPLLMNPCTSIMSALTLPGYAMRNKNPRLQNLLLKHCAQNAIFCTFWVFLILCSFECLK